MPHGNSWMRVRDPRPCTPSSYAVAADPTPDAEEISVLTAQVRRMEYAHATVVYTNHQLRLAVDQLRREKDRWHLLAVQRGG